MGHAVLDMADEPFHRTRLAHEQYVPGVRAPAETALLIPPHGRAVGKESHCGE